MTKIDPTQPSQPADKPSKPAKAQPQQPIIIDFSVLPDKLKTQEVRAKFDKDGSGFLESNGKKGNEYLAMAEFAKSMNIDLSKYKSDIVKVKSEVVQSDGDSRITWHQTRGYDKNGKPVVDLVANIDYDEVDEDLCNKGYSNRRLADGYTRTTYENGVERSVEYDKDAKPIENGEKRTAEFNVTFRGQKGLVKITTTKQNEQDVAYERGDHTSSEGPEFVTDDYYSYREHKEIDDNGEKTTWVSESRALKGTITGRWDAVQDNFYYKGTKEKEMFDDPNSKNKLVKTETSEYKRPNIGEKRMATQEEREANTKKSSGYTLNGKPVQVRRSKNARFEITTDKNETKFYSHDGKNLRIDYATGDEKVLPDGRKIVSSLDGKTNWYFDRDGKSVSVAEFYDWKHTPFAINKNGNKTTYTYCGKQVKAVPIENGRYRVTLPNGKTVTCSHDGKLLKNSYVNKK